MFHFLGRVVSRAWAFLLVAWVALLVGTYLAAPHWDEVAEEEEFAFLPPESPVRQSEEIFAKAFPDDHSGGNIVIVLHRADHKATNIDRELQFISDVLEPGLRKIAEDDGGLAIESAPSDQPLFGDSPEPAPAKTSEKRSIIARIRTPNAPGAGALLVSPDKQASLVVVELTTGFFTRHNWPTITKIEQLLEEIRKDNRLPPGIELTLTGSAVIGRDHLVAQLDSVKATELLTVLLVVVLLVIIYRAPLLAIIPLATVFLAVQLSINLLALMAKWGWITVFPGMQIYITVLAYGAGVDYCLFLTARYKEELDRGAHPADGVPKAIGGVGAALVASAATVMFGIGMMYLKNKRNIKIEEKKINKKKRI